MHPDHFDTGSILRRCCFAGEGEHATRLDSDLLQPGQACDDSSGWSCVLPVCKSSGGGSFIHTRVCEFDGYLFVCV